VGWDTYLQFHKLLGDYSKAPRTRREVLAELENIFLHVPELVEGFEDFMSEAFPEQRKLVIEREAKRISDHQLACEKQAGSPLLNLPRELRDTIWTEAMTGNVFHITPAKKSKRSPRGRFRVYYCSAPGGLSSSACPPGTGDHIKCSSKGPSQISNLKTVCKQVLLELPSTSGSIFSGNAFQFSDVRVAENFLFGISEPERAAITHLRFALPSEPTHNDRTTVVSAWESICNYFSNPWTRKCVCTFLSSTNWVVPGQELQLILNSSSTWCPMKETTRTN
jgi:hypothetical protein